MEHYGNIATINRKLLLNLSVVFLCFVMVICDQSVSQLDEDDNHHFATEMPKNKTSRQENSDTVFQFWSTTTTSERSADFAIKKRKNNEESSPGKVTLFMDNVETKAHLVTTSARGNEDIEEAIVFDDDDEAEVKTILDDEEEKDLMDAADYGLKKMKELYEVEEPKLYKMGLWLEEDNPARLVATFNWQSNEASSLAKYGYATLQAEDYLKKKSGEDAESRISGGENSSQRPSLSKQSPLRQQCPLRGDPRCPPASKRYRTHDGTCNNFRKLRWGAALTAVQRFLPPVYSDGVQAPRRGPSPRAVTAAVHLGSEPQRSPTHITHMLMQWGQMLDHDITASSQARAFNGSVPRCCRNGGKDFISREFLHPDCLPISVSDDDPFYGPLGVRCLDFIRSSPAPRVDCQLGWREQMNQVTSYIDGSPIYGSSVKQSDKLRLFRSGLLQYGRMQARRPVLPPEQDDEEALCMGGAVDSSCFKAGDGRVNEHPGLVAMHIVWLRKHNRIALEIAHLNPHWSDEKVYQETRKIIGAFIQHITFKEFLPIVLGSEVMKLFDLNLVNKGYYNGYSSKVNPSPANAFGAAAFRFGHSLVQDSFVRYDRFHRPLPNNVPLHEELSNQANLMSFGAVDRLILGLSNQPAQKRDEIITPELTNHLFQSGKFPFGMDLASINIQRGRDHGLPPYIDWREPCGLTLIESWNDLTSIMSPRTVRRMQQVYRSVEDIDLFTGGIAEKPVIGGLVGPTFACIIAQQFSNLRRGDRFWYENGGFESSFTPAQLQQIRRITLSQVLCQTMENIDTLQPFIFLSSDSFRNSRISCNDDLMNTFDLLPWTERISDFDNNINSFDSRPILSSPRPFPNFDTDNDFSESQTDQSFVKTTPPSTTDIKIDDKLDIIDKSTDKTIDKAPILQNLTMTTIPTTNPTVLIDDKLDFESKTILDKDNKTLNISRSVKKRNLEKKNDLKTNSTTSTNSTLDKNSPSKTYDFLLDENGQLPFFGDLFNPRRTTTTTRKPYSRPRPSPQVYSQNDNQNTQNNEELTYLINIVPVTTPVNRPEPVRKQTVKITIQQSLDPSTQSSSQRKPIYNNNRLEYRPISDDYSSYGSSRPQIINNRPYNTNNRPITRPPLADTDTISYNNEQETDNDNFYSIYDFSNNRPKPIVNRPRPITVNRPKPIVNRPSFDDSYTTEYNPYGLTTFSHIQTTKRPDLFNRPTVQSDNSYGSNSNSNNYDNPTVTVENINPRPVASQSIPFSTGITIYIDNKPTFVRPSSNSNFNTNVQSVPDSTYGSSSQSTFIDNDSDNVPIYSGHYDKPDASQNEYPKPFPFDRPSQNQFSTNNRPTYETIQTVNTYNVQHKETSSFNNNKLPKPKPNVNLHLASEHGHQQRPDLSIVLDTRIRQKSKSTTSIPPSSKNTQSTSISSTMKPVKFYYIGNILHKKTPNEERSSNYNSRDDLKKVILKENYNSKWSPDKDEHEHYYGTNDTSSVLNNDYDDIGISSKESEDELETDLSIKRKIIEQSLSKSNLKVKDQVFFDVIPSENSATRWLIYNETPDDEVKVAQMPELNVTDSQASSELPKPMGFLEFRVKHRKPVKSN